MPKFKTEKYTENEIIECQKESPTKTCEGCMCTIEECIEELELIVNKES